MLRPSSARDASTCLRCNLRLVLQRIHHRRYQSTDESPLPTQDFPASTSAPSPEQQQTPQPSRLRVIRTHGSHGKIRGKKGGQRRVESSESLSIASLGQSSEVIVLRDLHEPRPQKKSLESDNKPTHHAESTKPKPPALTGRDIENMSGRRALRPRLAEVFESIDALRPDEGIHVLTEDEFRQNFAALNKGYTMSQLRGYLVQKTAPAKPASSKPNKFRRVLTESNESASTEISSTINELQNLKRTAWHAGTTSMTKRLPMVDFSMSIGRKMNNKDDVIESILRNAWALGIEEEQAGIGEMEFLLSPMQFGLLLTKNSQTLKPLLESSKFYRNSRFQLHQAERVIRIVGPRAEAEAIAHVLTEAYAPARSADIDLETFHAVLQGNPSGFTLRDILTPAQLTNIMALTRTYIHYDVDGKRLRIASFVDVAINDAHRLLIALLPSNSQSRVTHLYDSHEADDCRLEALISTKNLPSHAKHRQLGRWVTASPWVKQSGTEPTLLDHEHSAEKTYKHAPIPGLQSHSPIIEEAVALMKSCQNASKEDAPEIESSIWPQNPGWNLWRARVGLSLHDLQNKDIYPGLGRLSSSLEEPATHPKQIFSFQVPGLIGLLSTGTRKGSWTKTPPERTELTAHLIPSPLEQTGILASATLPAVQLRFYIKDSTQPLEDDMRMSALLPDGKRIVLRDMRAVMTTEAVQLNLPSHPADLRFEREQSLVSKWPAKDPRIRSFVEAIFESMANDTSLRAPPALQIPVPQMSIGARSESLLDSPQHDPDSVEIPDDSRKVIRGQTVVAKYLFAGFEHNELRRYDLKVLGPGCVATLQSTEAGVTGGRRLELSLRYSGKRLDDGGDDTVVENLAHASVKAINVLAKHSVKEPDVHRDMSLIRDTSTKSRRRQLDTTKPTSLGKEHDRATYRPTTDEFKQDRNNAFSIDDTQSAAEEEAMQAEVANDREPSTMEKVAKQEQGVEMDNDQDPRVQEVAAVEGSAPETIAIERPESQTRIFDADVEHGVTPASEQPPTSSTNTIEQDMSAQKDTQASSESATQEVKAEESKAPEEEPLSVRLRRMMGGGA
ncbi:hypothetical protein KCU81_g7300, partial [Aureobasidium melanogenum]|uniref:Mitochondrial inner-membrane-bound regulator-domain-containing protein n=1 Tax=Aureobasidium melanogenum (strain CBS 110374) TaxID=1043003 RepID=A0A074WK68_AURM1